MADPILRTGLFMGKRLSQVPRGYLELLFRKPDLQPYLSAAVAAELWRRREDEAQRRRPPPTGRGRDRDGHR
jgi:hypothetical protein